ncbi:MAG: NAD-binding protein [Dehalococcoidia bacterium]|nr:NAD-binding protein [Dehalococcoidia bacterium]
MFVVIAGAGLVGRYLAENLSRDNHRVVIIEKEPTVAKIVAKELGLAVIEGESDNPNTLDQAGIRGADAFIAVTGEDEDNLVACTLAKFEFHVTRVMARVNNPKNEWMFGSDMGVDIAVSQAMLMGKLLQEEVTLGDLVTLLKLREGEVALVEKPIAQTAKSIGRQVKDLGLPEDATIVAVLRKGKVLVPRPDLSLQVDDRVLILTATHSEQKVAAALS